MSLAAAQTPAGFILVGATATGKTRVAHCIAEQDGAVILSADAMLVYRGMDIGTAKPGAEERARVPYFGIDLVDPHERCDVAQWLRAARAAWEEAARRGRPLLVVGGTGLYVRCLVEGLSGQAPDPVVRAHWQAVHARGGVAGLQAALRDRAPAVLAGLADPLNPRRLIRALEAAAAGGEVPPPVVRTRPPPVVGLHLPREAHKSAIESRVRAMYDHGLVAEALALTARPQALSETARHAIGYAEALAAGAGTLTQAQAMTLTAQRTRQYAKRQRTWFLHQATVSWVEVDPAAPAADVAAAVRAQWQRLGPTPLRALQA